MVWVQNVVGEQEGASEELGDIELLIPQDGRSGTLLRQLRHGTDCLRSEPVDAFYDGARRRLGAVRQAGELAQDFNPEATKRFDT